VPTAIYFSNGWKKPPPGFRTLENICAPTQSVFQALEKIAFEFPDIGKAGSVFSEPWKGFFQTLEKPALPGSRVWKRLSPRPLAGCFFA
jgi:hypothetical protein